MEAVSRRSLLPSRPPAAFRRSPATEARRARMHRHHLAGQARDPPRAEGFTCREPAPVEAAPIDRAEAISTIPISARQAAAAAAATCTCSRGGHRIDEIREGKGENLNRRSHEKGSPLRARRQSTFPFRCGLLKISRTSSRRPMKRGGIVSFRIVSFSPSFPPTPFRLLFPSPLPSLSPRAVDSFPSHSAAGSGRFGANRRATSFRERNAPPKKYTPRR